MSTSRDPRRTAALVTPLVMVAIVVSLFAALYPRDPSTAWGELCGGGLASLAVVLLLLRRRASDIGFVRTATGYADERDDRILMVAAAWTGISSVPLVALGMVAVVWHAHPLAVLGAMSWAQVVVFAVAHAVASRRC